VKASVPTGNQVAVIKPIGYHFTDKAFKLQVHLRSIHTHTNNQQNSKNNGGAKETYRHEGTLIMLR
jgi:hypothetical protein